MSEKRMLEVWGGFECSVVRLGSTYRNQITETGHAARPDDIERAYALGLRTLRYPALWETIAPDDPDTCDWSWHDSRFERLRRFGIRPIVGLVHHGSGPRSMNLLDPALPEMVERHAGHVARRYPWAPAWLGEADEGRRRALETLGAAALAVELAAGAVSEATYRRTGVAAATESKSGRTEKVLATGLGVAVPLGLYLLSRATGRRPCRVSGAAVAIGVMAGSALLRVSMIESGAVSARRPDVSLRFTQPENLPENGTNAGRS
jgi:hypothetical protein